MVILKLTLHPTKTRLVDPGVARDGIPASAVAPSLDPTETPTTIFLV